MATLKKVKKSEAEVKPLFSVDDIGKMGKEYAELSFQIKQLEERKKLLAEKIRNDSFQHNIFSDRRDSRQVD